MADYEFPSNRRPSGTSIISSISAARAKATADLEATKVSLEKDKRERDHKRTGWIEDARAMVTVVLVWSGGAFLITFTMLIFSAGLLPPSIINHSIPGVQALEALFIKMVESADTVVLIGLGFFFREYIHQVMRKMMQ